MAVCTIRTFRQTTRYEFDGGECTVSNGWAQLDTSQDAHYYGTWASPGELAILSYVEGDITLSLCDSREEFVAIIRSIAEFADELGYGPLGIDPGRNHNNPVARAFVGLGLGDLLH